MNKLAIPLVITVLLAFPAYPRPAAATDVASGPGEHTAVYSVSRNGEQVAKVTLQLSRHGDEWVYRGFTHDMQGLGKLLQVEGEQTVEGAWVGDHFQPRTFTFSFSLVGFRSGWNAEFDWRAGTVTTSRRSKKTTLPLDSGAMDPISLFLNTGSMLAGNQAQISIDVIDDDEIDSQIYEVERGVLLDTQLGCMLTTRVERVHRSDKRQSIAWYADGLGYVPVQLQHLKKKGSNLKVKILSLVIEGREIPVTTACGPATGRSASD